MTTTTIGIHVHEGDEIKGSARGSEHDYSDGPYSVMVLELGNVEITVWPGKGAAELAKVLTSMAADLTRLVEVHKVAALIS